MIKKVLLAAVLALTFLSAIGIEAYAPPPTCNPCPWVN